MDSAISDSQPLPYFLKTLERDGLRRGGLQPGIVPSATSTRMKAVPTIAGGVFTLSIPGSTLGWPSVRGSKLDFRPLADRNQEAWVIRDEIEVFANQKAKESGKTKSEERTKAEVEVYSYLYFWPELAPVDPTGADWKGSFLSQGGFLNRIALEGPYPIGRAVVVWPEGLFDLLIRLGQAPAKFSSFAGVLHSSYLYSAEYFIDKKRYARFFGSLINEAERIYAEGLDAYKEHIDESLGAQFLGESDPLERPLVVERLETGLKASLGEMRQKNVQLEREKEDLAQQLKAEKAKTGRLGGKEERMKEYGEKAAKRNRRKQGH